MTSSHSNRQSPSSIVMIRPHHFNPNPETLADNGFQGLSNDAEKENISKLAYLEFTQAVELIKNSGINVHLFEDESHHTPDSVFPNNWFSTHPEGKIVLYPMYAPNRRKERRSDIIQMLKYEYEVCEVVDYSSSEQDGLYLEGTGAVVIDHLDRVAYMIPSNRGNSILFERFCRQFNFEPFVFTALDLNDDPIYHTNVFMSIGTDFAVLSLQMIPDVTQREKIVYYLSRSGRDIIDISAEQVYQFAGNCIELSGDNGKILVVSSNAFNSLTKAQIATIEKSAILLPLNVGTIELAGGSVRCMIAAIHLLPKTNKSIITQVEQGITYDNC
ncbi:MAG: hypothetical protein ACI9C4_001753 [Paraglaciecola sp.]|jgi:hypothetical protein